MTREEPVPRPSDKLIPWYIVLFFVLQTILFGWFMHVAHISYTGLVTDQAYEKGLAYNNVIDEERAQEKLGFTPSITKQGDNIIFTLQDQHGKSVDASSVIVTFFRPAHAGVDFSREMTPQHNGYFASATVPEKGLWELRFHAITPQGHYRLAKRMVLE